MNINYMLVSTIILIIAILIFALMYEESRPKARHVVLIAVMSSLTVVSNIICNYTIPFHAGTAMVILTGIALGPRTGFLVGVLSRFVCNFFMGQGMWTPWEMAAWGLLGALGGILFTTPVIIGYFEDKNKVKLENAKKGLSAVLIPLICIAVSELAGYLLYIFTAPAEDTFSGWRLYVFGAIGIVIALFFAKTKLPSDSITTSVFTFVSVFIVYGGIMNIAAMFMNSTVNGERASVSALKILFITGIPYDFMHAFGAALCMFLFGDSILQKLERIKVKYGVV